MVLFCWVLVFTGLAFLCECRIDGGDSRLAELESRLSSLAGHVQLLEERDRQSQAKIRSLKSELEIKISDLNGQIDQLAQKDEANQAEIRSLKSELYKRQQRTEEPAGKVTAKHTDEQKDGKNVRLPAAAQEGTTTEADTEDLTGPVRDQRGRRQGNEQAVAFYATLENHVIHAGPGQNVHFDHVVTNVGAAYSVSLGAFIAPVSGIYVFSVWLTAYNHETEQYALSKNGKEVTYMYARGQESPYMVTGQTAILQLTKGDNVEIKTVNADGSLHGSYYSSFAGFLLQQDYSAPVAVGK